MTASILKVAPEELKRFCAALMAENVYITQADPEDIACRFRRAFQLRAPLSLATVLAFLDQLGIKVITVPKMEPKTTLRGGWAIINGVLEVRLNGTRPEASRAKTALHELLEILVAISMAMYPNLPKIKDQESQANKFAANIKMPPGEFIKSARATGCDINMLRDDYNDTVAGVTRQLRDYVMHDIPFCFWRVHEVRKPERTLENSKLLPVVEASGGICVRIEDIVKTRFITGLGGFSSKSRYGSPLPLYNAPLRLQYRVMPPEVKRAIADQTPLLLRNVAGSSGYEARQADLLGEYNLHYLVLPFCKGQERGALIIGIHPDHWQRLHAQVSKLNLITRDDVDWLFSFATERANRRKVLPDEQDLTLLRDPSGIACHLALPYYDENGDIATDDETLMPLDLDDDEYVRPTPSDTRGLQTAFVQFRRLSGKRKVVAA